jgi:ABC-type sugar transport system permease subunit
VALAVIAPARRRLRPRVVAPYLFIAPFFVLYAVFSAYPVLYSFWLSFHVRQGMSTPRFIGLGNYLDLLSDARYLKALANTATYAGGIVFILVPLALAIAVALGSRLVPLSQLFRLAYFLPAITSAVVISIMFSIVFDYRYGLLNRALAAFGARPVPWINEAEWALSSLILLGVWTWTGLNTLYFLAGLKGIPQELIEAALIDGATPLGAFRHVTLPLLRPVTLFVVISAINGSFQVFAQPRLLTQGGPSDATLTLTLYLYDVGFGYFNLGYASAIAYSIVAIILTLALVQLRIFRVFRED